MPDVRFFPGAVRITLALLLAALLALVGLLTSTVQPVAAQNDTRFVAPDGADTDNDCADAEDPCATIQHAIDEASTGDTIEVAAGTYNEVLEIDKSITLLGPNAGVSPITDARGDEAVITSPGDNAIHLTDNADLTVDGFTFDDVERFVLTEDVGLGSLDPSGWGNVDMRNNIFRNAASADGGYFWFRDDPGEQLVFQNNYLTGNALSNGLRIRAIQRSDPGAGLVSVVISDNLWEDNAGWALNVNNIEGVIERNRVRNQEITGDPVLDNQWGMLLATEDTNLEVTDNEFVTSPLAGCRPGLWVQRHVDSERK